MTRKDGVHALRAKQRMYPPVQAYILHPGAVWVETTRTAMQRLQAWSAYLGNVRYTAEDRGR